MNSLSRNIESVRARMTAALARAGRPKESVLLCVVTKTRPVGQILALKDLGVTLIGENRVQELSQKYGSLNGAFDIHFIGHLQTNKVRQVAPMVGTIQSVDSMRLARAVDAECARIQKTMDVLVEVNTSDESAKYGVREQDLLPLLTEMAGLSNLRVRGLMTMAMLTDDPEKVRACFRRLRGLRDRTAAAKIPNVRMDHLSMGMTQDFEAAIEEGATMVRIGSALFEGGERP
jgi:pyridoxal phosphate enzyme (YggS family)